MKSILLITVSWIALGLSGICTAKEISGEYIEARTCDVYTGPCFANGEVGNSGKEAVLAWMIDEGSWRGEDLSGLGVALVITANDTLGFGGSFLTNPDKIDAVVLLDDRASESQQKALQAFAEDSAKHLTKSIVAVKSVPLSLTNDHISGKGVFRAGDFAKIETRKLSKRDCVCSNETVFYPPLTTVQNSHPAYTLALSFQGEELGRRWTTINRRSAFLATFSR